MKDADKSTLNTQQCTRKTHNTNIGSASATHVRSILVGFLLSQDCERAVNELLEHGHTDVLGAGHKLVLEEGGSRGSLLWVLHQTLGNEVGELVGKLLRFLECGRGLGGDHEDGLGRRGWEGPSTTCICT